MADLKNSQRISYKATYVNKSPTTTVRTTTNPNVPAQGPMKAVEKTAFLQSLAIIPEELATLRKTMAESAAGSRGKKESSVDALNAIEKLISDKSSSSTLNNAALFANIDSAVLVRIAEALIALRETTADRINKAVAGVISGYREFLIKPTKPVATIKPAAGSQAPAEAAKPVAAKNLAGMSLNIQTFPATVKPSAKANQKVATHGMKSVISLDDTAPFAGLISPSLSKATLETYRPSNDDAILWAEQNQATLFGNLLDVLRPYLGVSDSESTSIGKSATVLEYLKTGYNNRFNISGTNGTIAGFQSRMEVEPVGNLHLERIEMYPAGIERGELIHSVPMAPSETANISHKEWSVTEQEFEDIVQDFFEGYSEQGVAEKNDMALSNESQSKHATALNVGASLSASYSSVTLSTNFGYSATSDDQQSKKDSRNHSMAITKKASARTKKDHKVTFKVTSVTGSEDQSVRVITNPSDTDAMRIDYFQLARKWKVDLLRYGLRMTYDIVIPNPGSGIVTKVDQVRELDALINQPFSFNLPLAAITYNSLAPDPQSISNYDALAAQYDASVTAPPQARVWVNAHKETQQMSDDDYNNVHFDSLDFAIDENYYIYEAQVELNWQQKQGDTNSYLTMLYGESIQIALANMVGESGTLSIDFMYQYIYNYALNITLACRPKVQVLLDWRLQAWNQIRSAAEEQFNKSIQNYKDQRAKLVEEINSYDALTLRRMEQEEIMKGVLRWLLGPQFYLVPFNIASLFGPDTNDPEVQDVLDPNRLSNAEWQDVMEHGEFIKYIHNAIEWENVLYFTYPYFWDDNTLWDFKKFLYHPDPTHRVFLRAGAARVVLTIRPGFEPSFTQLVESGAFSTLPGPHPYVTIAQEIQDFANTNYPGFPPANPEQNARPLLYLEQRRVWKEMQYIIQLLNAYKADPANNGMFPGGGGGDQVPAGALTPYLDGPITIAGVNYNGVNDYNSQANAKQLALDPNTPIEALLPTYTAVPTTDLWGNPYFYKSPGDTGDYDLISYGSDGATGGVDKAADISANAEASLIATWFEYTPTNALDIGITMNAANITPADVKPDIA
jgi:type II secretory pathway pseudopilin PulG